MKYKQFGTSNLKVSELCLGAMTFGEEFGIGAPEAESRRVFETFLEAGGNFVDTANIYNQGTSERMLSGFIEGRRDDVVLASKYSLSTRSADPNAGGNHRKNLVQSLEGSLRRLKTEYLDIYWVHAWDRFSGSILYLSLADRSSSQDNVAPLPLAAFRCGNRPLPGGGCGPRHRCGPGHPDHGR